MRGFRVELGDIEAALLSHETVTRCAVLLHEDPDDRQRLVAYTVTDGPPAVPALRSFLRERLPEYMVPTDFVLLDALPLTPTGKVDRRALPAPDQERPELGTTYVPPATPAEQVIADIWSDVLGIERVGAQDNFFDLGGHSLLATQIVSRLQGIFQAEMPVRNLFETTTVAGMVGATAELCGGRDVVEAIARTVQELEGLSEQEVRGQLEDGGH